MRRLSVFMLLLLSPALALAQGKSQADQEAKIHFESGRSYFETGEYDTALREFQKAYELSKRPKLFYNIALAHERLGDPGQAANYFRRYLAEVPDADDRDKLQSRAENLQRRADQIEREKATSAAAQEQARLAAEQAQQRQVATESKSASGPGGVSVSTSDKGGVPPLVIAAFVAAGVGLVTQATFGILALRENGKIADGCGANRACANSDVSTLRTFALISDIGLVTAIAGAAVGVVLWVNHKTNHSERSASLNVRPWYDPRAQAGGASASLAF